MTLALVWKGLWVACMVVVGRVSFAIPPTPRMELGVRGATRARARAASRLFRAADPIVRQVAAWLSAARVKVPGSIEGRLSRSGGWLGLSSTEALALCLVLGIAAGASGAALSSGEGRLLWVGVGFVVGAATPLLRIGEAERVRRRDATRELPGAIDALWLCLTAGLDFPAALRFVTADHSLGSTLRDELRFVLSELELGRTRVEALRAFESRLPFPSVQGFVAAVVQSEERGNPLAEVLRVQAEVLRAQRGVLAEEAASRAAVLLILPLMLMMGSILLLLFGPFIAGGFMQ